MWAAGITNSRTAGAKSGGVCLQFHLLGRLKK